MEGQAQVVLCRTSSGVRQEGFLTWLVKRPQCKSFFFLMAPCKVCVVYSKCNSVSKVWNIRT